MTTFYFFIVSSFYNLKTQTEFENWNFSGWTGTWAGEFERLWSFKACFTFQRLNSTPSAGCVTLKVNWFDMQSKAASLLFYWFILSCRGWHQPALWRRALLKQTRSSLVVAQTAQLSGGCQYKCTFFRFIIHKCFYILSGHASTDTLCW